jgi:hypothetical protein
VRGGTIRQCRLCGQSRQQGSGLPVQRSGGSIVVGADGTVEFRGREGVRGRSVFNVMLALDTCLLPYGRAGTVPAAALQR